MQAKAVLLVRVSTEGQEYETQIDELKTLAGRDGYSEEDMIIIADKESGSTVDDNKREGLIKLDEVINNPDIDVKCVYVWELSRLSRKPVTLMSRIYDLAEKKINFKTKELGIVLLDDNGNILPNTDVLLGMYVGMVKADSRTRTERIIRGKTGNALEGNYNGGTMKYGYKWVVDGKHKKYVLHPEESEIVKKIFELYRTGKYGLHKLYKELKSIGHDIAPDMITKILNCRAYTGEVIPKREFYEKVKGNGVRKVTRLARKYPKIIEPYVFEECRQIANKNRTNLQKSQTTYYAHQLIKCSRCGGFLKALKPKMLYRCKNAYNPVEEKNCEGKGGDSININVIDWLLWNLAKEKEITFRYNFNVNQIAIWENERAEAQLKIDNSEKQYQIAVKENRKKYYENDPGMTEEEKDRFTIRRSEPDKQRIEQEKAEYLKEVERLNNLINESEQFFIYNLGEATQEAVFGIATNIEYNITKVEDNKPVIISISELNKKTSIRNYVENTTDRERYDIIHKHIKEVRIYNEPKGLKRIEITFYESEPRTFYYAGMKKDQSKHLYYIENGIEKYLDYTKRFKKD
jgi:DNA invertase Pin-like site-specific DNA recombinase